MRSAGRIALFLLRLRRAARVVRAGLRRGDRPGEMGRVHRGAVGIASGAPRRGDRQRDLGRGDDVPRDGRSRIVASAAGSRRPPRSASPWTTSTSGGTTTCREKRSSRHPSRSSSGRIRWNSARKNGWDSSCEQVWNGFTPSGIRLTYAWGNGLPVGSMYRLWEEETVFVVAGPEEAGKTISSTRRLGDDFRAAYGRPPNGPVTEVRVSARRPSREKGPVRASITVRFPAPPE